MFSFLLVIIIILFLITISFLMRGKNRFSPMEFLSRGKEAGFTIAETNNILSIAKGIGLKDPTNALWSIKDLDSVIKAFTTRFKEEGKERDRDTLKFMEKLFSFRKNMEFNQPKYKLGITNTKQIKPNQRIKLLVQNIGVYNTVVQDTNDQFISIAYPIGQKIPMGFKWKGAKVSVYFWQQNDAGYIFDTYILDEVKNHDISILEIGHSESLLRTQKRKSIRIRSTMPAYLYILKKLEGAYEKPERVPGLKCIVEDVSEDGTSVLIGGKGKVGIFVKAQFFIDDDQIVMSGTVRGSDYNSEKNQSLLHIEAVPPSPRMKNIILSHVYNVVPNE